MRCGESMEGRKLHLSFRQAWAHGLSKNKGRTGQNMPFYLLLLPCLARRSTPTERRSCSQKHSCTPAYYGKQYTQHTAAHAHCLLVTMTGQH